jgi:hypothetical protein
MKETEIHTNREIKSYIVLYRKTDRESLFTQRKRQCNERKKDRHTRTNRKIESVCVCVCVCKTESEREGACLLKERGKDYKSQVMKKDGERETHRDINTERWKMCARERKKRERDRGKKEKEDKG